MKTTDLEKAKALVRQLDRLREMEKMVEGATRCTGYLELGNLSFAIPDAAVDAILADELKRISDEAAVIGLEFCE